MSDIDPQKREVLQELSRSLGPDGLRSLVEEIIIQTSATAEQVREVLQNEKANTHSTTEFEEIESRESLLQRALEKGRAIIGTTLPWGQDYVCDARLSNRFHVFEFLAREGLLNRPWEFVPGAHAWEAYSGQKQTVQQSSVVTVPLTERIEHMRKVQKKIPGWFGQVKIEERQEIERIEVRPAQIGKYTGNADDTEQAVRIGYVLQGVNETYRDPFSASHRTGNWFRASIIVPKSIADKLIKRVDSDPSIIRDLLMKFDYKGQRDIDLEDKKILFDAMPVETKVHIVSDSQ